MNLPGNVSVSVQIVHGERPLQLLLQFAPARDTEGAQKLPEVYAAVAVGVECAEYVLREFTGVPVWEEISIDLLEFFNTELSVGAILEESLVPLLDLGIRELRVVLEILQHLGLQFAVLLTHLVAVAVAVAVGCLLSSAAVDSLSKYVVRANALYLYFDPRRH